MTWTIAAWITAGILVWAAAVGFALALCRAAAQHDRAEEDLARELRQRKYQRRYAPTAVGRTGHGVRVHGTREGQACD
jgi:hypothetical protein